MRWPSSSSPSSSGQQPRARPLPRHRLQLWWAVWAQTGHAREGRCGGVRATVWWSSPGGGRARQGVRGKSSRHANATWAALCAQHTGLSSLLLVRYGGILLPRPFPSSSSCRAELSRRLYRARRVCGSVRLASPEAACDMPKRRLQRCVTDWRRAPSKGWRRASHERLISWPSVL